MRTVFDISNGFDYTVKVFKSPTPEQEVAILGGDFSSAVFSGGVVEIASKSGAEAVQIVMGLFQPNLTVGDLVILGKDMWGILDGVPEYITSL